MFRAALVGNRTIRLLIAGLLLAYVPLFYVLLNAATPRYIHFPHLHIYGGTLSLLAVALTLALAVRWLHLVSGFSIVILVSWLVQNVALSTLYMWDPTLRADRWQPLPFLEALRSVLFGGGPFYWLFVLLPLAACVVLLLSSETSNKALQPTQNASGVLRG
jgi:hypothetical protein